MGLLGAALSLLGFGCATGAGEVRHGIGAGQWQARLPETRSAIQGLAYGRGGSSQRAADLADLDLLDLDAALAALDTDSRAARPTKPKPAAARSPARGRASVELAQREPRALPLAKTAEPKPASALQQGQVRVAEPVVLAQSSPAARYAEREAASTEQQQFAGGDAIVITSGAIVVVLLIVLLVLLLR